MSSSDCVEPIVSPSRTRGKSYTHLATFQAHANSSSESDEDLPVNNIVSPRRNMKRGYTLQNAQQIRMDRVDSLENLNEELSKENKELYQTINSATKKEKELFLEISQLKDQLAHKEHLLLPQMPVSGPLSARTLTEDNKIRDGQQRRSIMVPSLKLDRLETSSRRKTIAFANVKVFDQKSSSLLKSSFSSSSQFSGDSDDEETMIAKVNRLENLLADVRDKLQKSETYNQELNKEKIEYESKIESYEQECEHLRQSRQEALDLLQALRGAKFQRFPSERSLMKYSGENLGGLHTLGSLKTNTQSDLGAKSCDSLKTQEEVEAPLQQSEVNVIGKPQRVLTKVHLLGACVAFYPEETNVGWFQCCGRFF